MSLPLKDDEIAYIIRVARGLFESFKMKEALISTGHLVDQMEAHSKDYGMINTTFKNLQVLAENDFARRGPYQKRVMRHLMGRLSLAMVTNIDETKKAMNAPPITTIPYDRANAYKVLNNLTRMLMAGAKSDEDNLLGLSYSYANAVEGIYKKSIQDCYIWEKMANKKNLAHVTVPEMDVGQVLDYYRTARIEMVLFEGYDPVVRNAVGHSTQYYLEPEKKMEFKDKKAGLSKKYSFPELLEKYMKLKAVHEAVLVRGQVVRVNDACIFYLKKHGILPKTSPNLRIR